MIAIFQKRGDSMKDSSKVLISAWISTGIVVLTSMIIDKSVDNMWVFLIPMIVTLIGLDDGGL